MRNESEMIFSFWVLEQVVHTKTYLDIILGGS